MKIFVATSYSSKVNYKTGEVFAQYKAWLDGILATLEAQGHTVFCALRADQYRINDANPAEAFRLDAENIRGSDAVLALLADDVSAGVQTEIGMALALGKKVFLAHETDHKLSYFNAAMIRAAAAQEITLPLAETAFSAVLN